MGIPQVFVAVGGVFLFVARRRQGVGRRVNKDSRRDATKSSGNARDAPTRLGTVPRRRRRENDPSPVSSSEDIAPTASEGSSTSEGAPSIDSEAVVSSRGADMLVPGVEGNDEGAAEAASDSTGITPSTVNEGVIDAVVDDSVVKGDIEAETSPEGPAEGASNVRPDGEGEHQLRVNSEDEDRSSFGSVSKTPIRPHASGGLGRVVTRSSSPPLSSSSRRRRTVALAAVRAAARAASTASDGSWSSTASEEDDSEVTGPSSEVTGPSPDKRVTFAPTVRNDENAVPPASPATPARVLVKDTGVDAKTPAPTLSAIDPNRSPTSESPSTEVKPSVGTGTRFICDSPLVCATPVVGTKRPVRGEKGRAGLTRVAQIRIVKSPSFTDRSMAPLTALSPPKDVVWEKLSAREQANWVGAGKVPNFSRFKTPGPKSRAELGEEEDEEEVMVRVSHEAMHAVGNMRYSADNAWSSPSDGSVDGEEDQGPYGALVSTLSPNTIMDGASPATFARRYVEASVTRVEGMAADEMEHEAIARAYVDASEMRVGAMLRASGN